MMSLGARNLEGVTGTQNLSNTDRGPRMDAGMQGPGAGFQETCLKGWNEAAAHRVKPGFGGGCELLSWEVA